MSKCVYIQSEKNCVLTDFGVSFLLKNNNNNNKKKILKKKLWCNLLFLPQVHVVIVLYFGFLCFLLIKNCMIYFPLDLPLKQLIMVIRKRFSSGSCALHMTRTNVIFQLVIGVQNSKLVWSQTLYFLLFLNFVYDVRKFIIFVFLYQNLF